MKKDATLSCPEGYELACTEAREPDKCSCFRTDIVTETLSCRDLGCVSVVSPIGEFSL